jgi:hypothetical protein
MPAIERKAHRSDNSQRPPRGSPTSAAPRREARNHHAGKGLAPLACGSGPSARLPEANSPEYKNLRKEIGDKYAKFRSYKVEDLLR